MRSILLFIIVVASNLVDAQKKPVPDNRLNGIDAKLQTLLAEWKVAGFAVAVVEKDKVVYARGFGYRDYENKKPVTPNTLFAIGSCSKAFTSSILGILSQDKKLELTGRPAQYVDDLRFFNDDMNNDIMIKDLMCHRTGLPRHDYGWYLFNTSSRDSLIKRIQYQEPSFAVRERWQYNNWMFLLQGVIAEKITGDSWEKNIKDKIFTPLQMSTSNLTITDLQKSAEPSLGYEAKDDKEINRMDYYNIDGMGPAGSINSSVNEMANWVTAWINGGKFKGMEILPAAYVSQAMSAQMVVNSGLPSKEHPDVQFSNYGYGWFLASYKSHYRVEHGGNINGFSASISFFPSDSLGIVVLVNQNGSPVPGIVRNMVADRMLKVSQTDWSKEQREAREKARKQEAEAKAKATSSQKKGTKPSHLLEQFEGKYSHPGYGTMTLLVKRDSLFVKTGYNIMWLKHYHYDIFQPFELDKKNKIDTAENTNMRFNFRSGNDGEIETVSINNMEDLVGPIEFKREAITKAITVAEMQKYIGEYELAGMVAKVFIKGESSLTLIVPGQPEYDLLYLGSHKFSIKSLNGYKIEFEETGGKIKSASFIQPNGTFKAMRKD